MTWEVIPDDEMPAVLSALEDGRCVSCYGAIGAGHTLYCHACDDGCGPECEA